MRLIIAGRAEDAWVRLEPETSDEIMAVERSVAQGDWTIGRGSAAIDTLRALATRLGYPVRVGEERETSAPPPRLFVVPRGETALAARLRAMARSSVPVIWDRREQDRRTTDRPFPADRRRRDRRGPPPSTWGTLHFLVVPSLDSPGATE